jgi:MtrB/PioB family decaheme-associated outer membrane protein
MAMTRRLMIPALLAVLAAAPLSAQPAPDGASPVQVTGSMTTGIEQVDNDTNSSKLSEYRDLRSDFFLSGVRFSLAAPAHGVWADFRSANLGRRDQGVNASVQRPGAWRVEATWSALPHNFSNKAQTPFIDRGAGLLTLPGTVPITFKRLATAAADAPSVVASDELVAAYQSTFLRGTALGTDITTGRFAASWSGTGPVTLGLAWDRRAVAGTRSTFGPIGDRPPRTLNVQIAEPVDHATNDFTLSAEHAGRQMQARLEYVFSDFSNGVDTLTWQNVFATPGPGATSDLWDRAVSVYGRRPLSPDNRYHNVTGTVGRNLPGDSRVTATAGVGRLEQDQTLLPYSFNHDVLVVQALPRASANAEMVTRHFAADYVLNPAPRLNMRVWARHYGLSNNTPEDRWQYVTSDTANLNGTTSYKNRRVNLAYGYDRTNAGGEATYRLPSRSAMTIGYELEDIGRDYREADTVEHRLTASFRSRPARWMNVRARYLFGARDGGEYNGVVTQQSYWYARADAGADQDNPGYTFSNHPDMRRYDVSDRQRHQVELKVDVSPGQLVALSGFVRYRRDDLDSPVAPSQPLLGLGLADEAARTPGEQLGLLEDARLRYGVDIFVMPRDGVTFNAFVAYDLGTSAQRSIEFNENNKQNPSAVALAELGPWTRAGSLWTADFDDRTWSAGLGGSIPLVANRATLTVDYTLSLAAVDIDYGGFGVTNWNGAPFPDTHQFAFRTPPTIREDLHALGARVDVHVTRAVMLLASYRYERYVLDDWQQGSTSPWAEPVGSEFLLRDTSRSHQWGNRLFNLGTYLAPTYRAHLAFVGVTTRF